MTLEDLGEGLVQVTIAEVVGGTTAEEMTAAASEGTFLATLSSDFGLDFTFNVPPATGVAIVTAPPPPPPPPAKPPDSGDGQLPAGENSYVEAYVAGLEVFLTSTDCSGCASLSSACHPRSAHRNPSCAQVRRP